MNFPLSSKNPIPFILNGNTIDRPSFGLDNSSVPLSHLNEAPRLVGDCSAFVSGSQEMLMSPDLASVTDLRLHSNSHNLVVSQATNSDLRLGQVGLRHRMTEVSKTIVTAGGIQLHTVVDYDFTPRQQGLASLSEVTDNFIPRSQLLGALSTRDRIFFQNNNMNHQFGPPTVNSWDKNTAHLFNSQSLLEVFDTPKSSHYYAQPPQLNPLLNLNDIIACNNKVLTNCAEVKTSGVLDLQPIIQSQSAAWMELNNPLYANQKSNRWSQPRQMVNNLQQMAGQTSPSHHWLEPSDPVVKIEDNSQGWATGIMIGSSRHQWQERLKETVPSLLLPSTLVEEETKDDEGYDGQTHSLCRRKYGPYVCPKCFMIFRIPQRFASHIASHYRHETMAERMRRYRAKFKSRDFELIQSPCGLTVMPKSSPKPKTNPMKARGCKRNVGLGLGITIEKENREFPKNPTPIPPLLGMPLPSCKMLIPLTLGMPISSPAGMPIPPPSGMSHPYEKAPLPKIKAEVEN